jgi:asparagine synthetase B (glutamine-hydrolysing)
MTRFKSSGTNKYIKISNDYKIRLKNFWKPISNLKATFQQKIILMEEIYTEAPSCQNHQKKLLEFFGLKVLNPYYDPDFIKYTISLSDCWRQKNNYNKYLLYKLAEKNEVPREVIEKEKKGLSYGFTHFIQNKYHLRIWDEILANKLLSKYIDIELAFKKEKDNFFLFDRLMSAHYFIKYVLNGE